MESPIRVLHILGSMQHGGTETVVFNNYRNLDRGKIQFDITVDEDSPCDVPKDILGMGCRIYRIPSYTRLFAYIAAINRLCRENQYVIVHSHMNAMSVFPLFAAWLGRVPVRISHSHSTAARGDGEFVRNGFKYMLRPFSTVFATHYFACSGHAGRWLFGDRAVEKGKVIVLNNAISVERFAFDIEKREKGREELGLRGKFVIGNVGRLSPQKNHSFLVDVFSAVLKRREDAHLMLVGGIGSAGNGIEQELKKKISEYGIGDKVSFFGSMEDISGLYQAMDVFVLPSLYEGLGIACIEAQCSGLPCVLSDRVPRVVQINDNVKFLSLDDAVEMWVDEIINSRGTRGDYSENVSVAGYDIKKVATILEEIYMKLKSGGKRIVF